MEQWQFVKHVGEPLTLMFPVDVESPQCVVDRLSTH